MKTLIIQSRANGEIRVPLEDQDYLDAMHYKWSAMRTMGGKIIIVRRYMEEGVNRAVCLHRYLFGSNTDLPRGIQVISKTKNYTNCMREEFVLR